MRKTLQKVMSFYLLLFLVPILTIKLPMLAFGSNAEEKVETHPVAYAANVTKEIPIVDEETEPLNVLLYFTHSHEAYQPIVEEQTGKKAVNYHASSNITNVSDLMTQHLQLHGANVDVLPYDNMKEMKTPMYQAYKAIRPVLQKQISAKSYDLIIDFHRDALPHKASTIEFHGESFARVSLVVGAEHPNYKLNEAYAKSVSEEVNRLIPGMSRGVIPKSGDNVDGVYNQDLSPEALLIEIGGQENNEQEINRTVAVIAKAVTTVFEKARSTQD